MADEQNRTESEKAFDSGYAQGRADTRASERLRHGGTGQGLLTSGKYGHVAVERGAGTFQEGEPVFLLRAQDMAALTILYTYAGTCMVNGAPDAHVEAIRVTIQDFRDWQAKHPPKVAD